MGISSGLALDSGWLTWLCTLHIPLLPKRLLGTVKPRCWRYTVHLCTTHSTAPPPPHTPRRSPIVTTAWAWLTMPAWFSVLSSRERRQTRSRPALTCQMSAWRTRMWRHLFSSWSAWTVVCALLRRTSDVLHLTDRGDRLLGLASARGL